MHICIVHTLHAYVHASAYIHPCIHTYVPTPIYTFMHICMEETLVDLINAYKEMWCVAEQIAKLSMIPVVCVLEWLLNGKSYTREVKAAVLVVVIGVGVCTVTDVNINLKGFISALFAVICTSLQQIVSLHITFF